MPHTRDIIMVRMTDNDDRFVTRPVMIPVHAIDIGLLVPDLQDAAVANVDVSPYPHVNNYPAPNYYRVKPAGNNPYPHPFNASFDYANGGILAEWRFDDADGTTATDEVEGYILTEQGNPTWQTSAAVAGLGSGVAFDGTGDILDVAIASASNLDITTGDFTMEVFCTITSGGAAAAVIMEHRGASDGLGYSMGIDASDQLVATIEDATSAVSITGETDVADGTNKHLVVTVDRDGNMTPYINGVAGSAVDVSSNTGTLSNTGRFAIGGDSDRANLLTGTIYFARVYNRALSADEVLQNYRVFTANEWPGWMRVLDQADGEDAVVVGSGQDPAAIDLGQWLRAFRGCYVRVALGTEQTSSRTYDFGWIFSGVT